MNYAIIGSGALGILYGARLQRSGRDVHFLARSDTEHIRAHGLKIESKDGDFDLPKVNVYASAREMPRCDVAVVALKTTQNDALKDILPHVVRPGGCVLILQNGLGPEDVVHGVLPGAEILGGLCFVCSNKEGPGRIKHLDYGAVSFGHYDAAGAPRGVTPLMQAVSDDFEGSGFPVKCLNDLVAARWMKLVWNIPYNGLTVVLDTTTDRLMASPHGERMCEDLMREVVAGAKACGREIPDAHVKAMLEQTRKMVPYRPSMKIDFDEARPMEIEAIFGNPWRAAKERGVELPKLGMLYAQLKYIEAYNRKA